MVATTQNSDARKGDGIGGESNAEDGVLWTLLALFIIVVIGFVAIKFVGCVVILSPCATLAFRCSLFPMCRRNATSCALIYDIAGILPALLWVAVLL